jgi:predicted DNA-binding transcriptional regulator YafY
VTGRDRDIGRRLVRVLSMAMLLRQQRITRARLAHLFGVCERQIQRDLRVLQRAGFRVRRYNGKRPGYEVAWPELDLESFTQEAGHERDANP